MNFSLIYDHGMSNTKEIVLTNLLVFLRSYTTHFGTLDRWWCCSQFGNVCGWHSDAVDIRAPIGMMFKHIHTLMEIVYHNPNCLVSVLLEPV